MREAEIPKGDLKAVGRLESGPTVGVVATRGSRGRASAMIGMCIKLSQQHTKSAYRSPIRLIEEGVILSAAKDLVGAA